MEDMMSQESFSAMQAGVPVAIFRKTILGKVFVYYINSFTKKEDSTLLEGDPRTDDRAKIDIWSFQEKLYFMRKNKKHFDAGELIEITPELPKPETKETKPIEQYSDMELSEILKLKPITFKKLLSEIESPAVTMRLLEIAKEEDKSAKMVESIEAKLSALQMR